MNVLSRLDEIRAAINVLEHPFYERWVAGELSDDELSGYAGEYRHAVVALADASEQAAALAAAEQRPQLQEHAEEERAHVQLWDRFARATGERAALAAGESPAQPQTRECVRAWTAGGDLLEKLAVLYAIEAGQPAISQTKLQGLAAHYGYSEEGPAVEYFALHAERDVEHAREARELIERLMADVEDRQGQADRMVARAAAALRGNWLLLDGVHSEAGAPAAQR